MGGRPNYGPTAQERTKCLLEAMLAYANDELEDCDRLKIEANWQKENQLVVRTKVRFLEELTAKYQQDGKLSTEQIKEALNRLKDWLEILEDNRTKTKGAEDWHFTLKLWSKDKQENLKRFEFEWESRKAKKSQSIGQKASPNPLANHSAARGKIDWGQIRQAMLKSQNQGRLTTNPLTTGDGVAFELDEIYVPLGLVERKQQRRVGGDVSPEEGSQLYVEVDPRVSSNEYEVTRTFQQNEFFEQVLRPGKSKRIAIIGEPGAGKTTLLQKIATWVIDRTSDVPIWISLADLQGKTLEQYLLQDWLKAATRKVRVTEAMQEALGELFNSGRVWLLLDGVDEMTVGTSTGWSPLQTIAQQIQGWVADARVVVTCRLNVWDAGKNALEAFDTYRNLDFSYGDAQTPDQVGQFISHWFKDNPTLGDRLRAELDQPGRERIKDAVKNPLRLALLCRAWHPPLPPRCLGGMGGLPNTKAGLYQQFTSALYEWKQDRFPTTSSQRQKLNRALGELAVRAISEEKTKFRLRHRLVSSVLGKPDEDLLQLALQLGFLNQVGVAAEAENRGEKVYAFYHPTFQEYFAAQAISDWRYFLNHIYPPASGTPSMPWGDGGEGIYRIFEPQWKEVILLWLGREDVPKEQKEEFIKALVEFEDGCEDFYKYRAYFLAAAGIAEFGDCSGSNEIVAQIVKWGFGYFNIEKQKWATFLKPIEEAARATLIETDHHQASAALVQLIESTGDEDIRRQAADSLGKIDPGNQTAIAALVQLIESTGDEDIRRQAADSLGKIGQGNSEAIAALVQLIESTGDEDIRRQAADSLGKIGQGNLEAIAALVQLIKSTGDEDTRWLAADSLGKIGQGNPEAIAALVQLIKSTGDEDTRWLAADSLGKIGQGNPEAIAALLQLIKSTGDEDTRWLAAFSLGKIDPGNQTAIAALVQLIESTGDEYTCWQAAKSLGEIDSGNQTAIAALVQLIESTGDKSTRWQAAKSLGEIGRSNPEAIAALVQLLSSTEDESTRRLAARSLGKIGTGNQTAIAALVPLITSTEDESTRRLAAFSLGKIDPGNQTAIAALVPLIASTEDEFTRWQAAESLKKILIYDRLALIVTALKDYLSDETYENNIERFRECYKLIWHCARNMPYPAFYQAWHTQPTFKEDKGIRGQGDKEGSASHAFTPQSLQSAIANNPILSQTIHLICIDGSKFIDRDNPAAKIYAQMVKGGCAKCDDGTPKTMAELQAYWDLLDSDKRIVLVFYQDAASEVKGKGQKQKAGFSEHFLDALSKFDGAICVVSEQPFADFNLQWFAPSQPQLVENIVGWLRAIPR